MMQAVAIGGPFGARRARSELGGPEVKNMKSRVGNIHFLKRRPRAVFIFVFAMVITSMAAHAQEILQIDPQRSVARLSLGSQPNELEVGLARVSGEVVFDASDPSHAFVNFKIAPEDEARAEYAEMSFTSKRSVASADGKLLVVGDLTVTRVERSVRMDGNEAYSGPQYGEPIADTHVHQITLVFADPRHVAAQNGVTQLSGTTSVSREIFPQFVDALAPGNWPTVLVDDEKCDFPTTFGEDYSGGTCSGTVIAVVANDVMMVGTAGGEDYSGFRPTIAPDRKQATVALDLKLKQLLPTSASPGGVNMTETK